MPTPSSTDYNINLKTGWVIITNAFIYGKEVKRESLRDGVVNHLKRLGVHNKNVTINDLTDSMEDWERRRTKKPFTRPAGMFIFRITDRNEEPKIGKKEMNEWPQR